MLANIMWTIKFIAVTGVVAVAYMTIDAYLARTFDKEEFEKYKKLFAKKEA